MWSERRVKVANFPLNGTVGVIPLIGDDRRDSGFSRVCDKYVIGVKGMLQVNLNDGYGRGVMRLEQHMSKKCQKKRRRKVRFCQQAVFLIPITGSNTSVVQGRGQWAGALILAKEVHILLESHELISRDMTT